MSAVLSHHELEGFAEALHQLLASLHEELADELNEIEHIRHHLQRLSIEQPGPGSVLLLARRLNLDHLSQNLEAIAACEAALERVNRGYFGRCVRCGEGIELNLLRADPLVDVCLCCQK
ncbi:TraR/DksA C4-type zinc finger protein [Marinobacterium weihaiense]|uniref:TraR/DksA C4-type zinc finger protein n=1 Tax=Marinobacterium weihaiense TaxID=2851016 RepID=A0ABS6M7F4_9GAMM|nr:TraR/DksA C4-type zinc finger protein [Marinobacterium weihaiense]MBV0932208.1 TraR/DksA C4-type zinc finger protein [Marinobacterium weihaiense]